MINKISQLKFLLILFYLAIITQASISYNNQYQPVIGVLAQPSNDLNSTIYPADKYQYIATSYVKWLQASGAKVIPIPFDLSDEEQDYFLSKINGLLFPGGDASLWVDEPTQKGFSNITIAGARLLKRVIDINKNGKYFPLFGTCLGYELITIALENNEKALDNLNSTNHVLNTQLLHQSESRLYSTFTKKQGYAVKNLKTFYYNHRYGVTLQSYKSNKILNEFFKLTAFSFDDNGTSFVSSMESYNYPIYVNQFHPEKNSYEWLESVHANHSFEAIEVAQAFGNFFVNEARKNTNTFSEQELRKFNIEQYPATPVYDHFVTAHVLKNKNFTDTEHKQRSFKNKNKLNMNKKQLDNFD